MRSYGEGSKVELILYEGRKRRYVEMLRLVVLSNGLAVVMLVEG